MRSLKVRRNVLASHAWNLSVMAKLTAKWCCRSGLSCWRGSGHAGCIDTIFERHMNLSRHQLPRPLHIVRSDPWDPFPSWWKRDPKSSMTFEKEERACPPQRCRLGSISKVQQLFNDIVHRAYQSLFVATSCHATIIFVLSTKGQLPALCSPFSSALHRTCLATRPHSTGASKPPCRMQLDYLSSVSLFSKHADPRTSWHSANRAAVRCPKVSILDTTDGFCTSNVVFTSKLSMKAALYLQNPGCKSVQRSSCHSQCLWNIFGTGAYMCSQLTPLSTPTWRFLHSIGSSSSCSKSNTRHWENTQKCDRTEATGGPFQAWRLVSSGTVSEDFFHVSGARHCQTNKPPSYTVSASKHHSVSVTRQSAGPWLCFSSSSLVLGEPCSLWSGTDAPGGQRADHHWPSDVGSFWPPLQMCPLCRRSIVHSVLWPPLSTRLCPHWHARWPSVSWPPVNHFLPGWNGSACLKFSACLTSEFTQLLFLSGFLHLAASDVMFLISSSTQNLFGVNQPVSWETSPSSSSSSRRTAWSRSLRGQSTSSWNLIFSASDWGTQPTHPFTSFFVLSSRPSNLVIAGKGAHERSLTLFKNHVVVLRTHDAVELFFVAPETPEPVKLANCLHYSSTCLSQCTVRLKSFNSCSHRIFSKSSRPRRPLSIQVRTYHFQSTLSNPWKTSFAFSSQNSIFRSPPIEKSTAPSFIPSVRGPSQPPGPRWSPPHRGTCTESSIVDPTTMAVHLSWSTHERRKWLTSRGHKMAVRPWSVPHTMLPRTFVAEVVQVSLSCRA